MKQPKYTDLRYPNGYVRAAATDVRKTFARIRKAAAEKERAVQAAADAAKAEAERVEREQAEQDARDAAEVAEKLRPMKRAAK